MSGTLITEPCCLMKLFFACLLPITLAYTIDSSCDPFNVNQEIQDSIQEAIDMANYGGWRAGLDSPLMSPLITQLLGDDGRNRFVCECSSAIMEISVLAVVPRKRGGGGRARKLLSRLTH